MTTPNEQYNIHAEPSRPVAGASFTKQAGNTDGRTADYEAWQKDIAETRARSAAFEAKRQANKPGEPTIDEALTALDAAATDFEESYGKPNQPLIDAKLEVQRLQSELASAETRLSDLEARGDSIQRLTNAVRRAENQLQALVSKAESEGVSRLAELHYGWPIPHSKISPEMKREFALHASVIALKAFYVPRSLVLPGQIPSVDSLQTQLQVMGEKLVALREHLAEVAH